MPGDNRTLRTKAWQMRRLEALERDNYTCVAPYCGAPATVVDHIISRRDGGSDDFENLRSLCWTHEKQVKEQPLAQGGGRRNDGKVRGQCKPKSGYPSDPEHPWFRKEHK
jgi:5-methylcytosine-specific restriction endonuclease McrA